MAKNWTASQNTLAFDPSALKSGACGSLVESTAPETSDEIIKYRRFEHVLQVTGNVTYHSLFYACLLYTSDAADE